MKKINRLILVLALLTVFSYADEKVKMKEPVELIFDTKVSCKNLKAYTDFIAEEIRKKGTEPIKTICSNDDTDGKLSIVDKDIDNQKIIHEPTNTVFSKVKFIDEKKYGITDDYKAYLVPKGIAYIDLDDDGVDEIFIVNYSEYGWFSMKVIKNNNGKFELFKNNMKIENAKVVILPTKTNGFHDIFYQTLNVKKKKGVVWKYEKNLEYNLDTIIK